MNTNKLKLAGLLIAFSAFFGPQTAEAYFTTDQHAYKLSDNTALFTVTYKFGHDKRDLYMPIGATRNAVKKDDLTLGFTVQNHGTASAAGVAHGIVLTKNPAVEVKDGKYFVPAGQSAVFTLYTLVTLTEDQLLDKPDVSVLVTHLPFIMKTDNLTITAHLNPSELQYYHTPKIDW